LRSALVTHAYSTFFDRTVANLEALIEGREIRIGIPVDTPAQPPIERIMSLLHQIGEMMIPLLKQIGYPGDAVPRDDGRQVDADGFTHIVPALLDDTGPDGLPDRLAVEAGQFLSDLGEAIRRDLALYSQTA
jgi:hypothetical protein